MPIPEVARRLLRTTVQPSSAIVSGSRNSNSPNVLVVPSLAAEIMPPLPPNPSSSSSPDLLGPIAAPRHRDVAPGRGRRGDGIRPYVFLADVGRWRVPGVGNRPGGSAWGWESAGRVWMARGICGEDNQERKEKGQRGAASSWSCGCGLNYLPSELGFG
jgi:hypothetical protein